jgi:hypothetical protein
VRVIVAVLALVVLATSACAEGRTGVPSGTADSARLAVILHANESLAPPINCAPLEVRDLLVGFVDAFNRGDQPQLLRYFAPTFQWYSMSEGAEGETGFRHFVTSDRDTLLRYFADRHQAHERLTLVKVDVLNANDWSVGVGVFLVRAADDIAPVAAQAESGNAHGKTMVDCARRTLSLWSVGMPAR